MKSSELKQVIENQILNISNDKWNVEVSYFKINPENRKLEVEKVIELQNEYKTNSIFISFQKNNSEIHKNVEINGLDGGFYLYKSTRNEKSQTVKLTENNLIMSLGFSLLSLNLNELKLDWIIRPDINEIFGFLDLKDDLLLRGESQIHRIDKKGNIKWSFGGNDIWVNLDGKNELNIEENTIRLFDFESNEYLLNFDGVELEYKPKITRTTKPNIFKFLKDGFIKKFVKE